MLFLSRYNLYICSPIYPIVLRTCDCMSSCASSIRTDSLSLFAKTSLSSSSDRFSTSPAIVSLLAAIFSKLSTPKSLTSSLAFLSVSPKTVCGSRPCSIMSTYNPCKAMNGFLKKSMHLDACSSVFISDRPSLFGCWIITVLSFVL